MGLRDFIQRLVESGDLKRVTTEVEWDCEIGERTRRPPMAGRNAPALMFENIAGYPGWRLLTNGLASHRRIAAALGLDTSAPFADCVDIFRQRLIYAVNPVMSDGAEFTNNRFTGTDIDLTTLPVPRWHSSDGGRYIGTWHINVSKDPATGIRNIGIYRMQLLGRRKTALSVSPGSHLARHLEMARKMRSTLEMAVAIGVDETVIMAAAAALPYGEDEYRAAGGLAQKPVALAPCMTVDLEVPANAEIVLEGTLDPANNVHEGPFFDYAGVSKRDPNGLIFDITGLSYRNNPIFRGAAVGNPGGEDHLLFSLLAAAGCLNFHGSPLRQKVQNALLRRESYKLFQTVGKVRQFLDRTTGGERCYPYLWDDRMPD